MIEPNHPHLSIRQQCELLGLPRSNYYYQPTPADPEDLELMRLLDRQFLETPFYGSRRLAAWLGTQGYPVNRKRVQRLMREMGLEALYPKPRTTVPHPEHRIYPYLLRDVKVERRDQVWSSDITYIPMPQGHMYLTVVLDWHSRYILSWRLSNTLDGRFCLEALEEALSVGAPEVFNTDQGVQFTARSYTERLKSAGVSVSMDGRGRALDDAFVERVWRAFKYEDVYIRGYATVLELEDGLSHYIRFYNEERLHQSLSYCTPWSVYHA